MNDKAYRLTRGKLHRLEGHDASKTKIFRTGEVFVPTDFELKTYKQNFEGPVDLSKPEEPAPRSASETALARATEDLAMGLPGIRDAIRTGDVAYLEALRQTEAGRKPLPRVKVLEMIDRRLKSLTRVA